MALWKYRRFWVLIAMAGVLVGLAWLSVSGVFERVGDFVEAVLRGEGVESLSAGWLMVLLALGTLVSEDLACIAAGMLAGGGGLTYLEGMVACLVGIFVGDLLLFGAGRLVGKPALGHPPLSWVLSEQGVERSQRWLRRRGAVLILATRFVPGSRLPTYVAAGMLGERLGALVMYFGLAAVLWTPLFVGVAYYAGGAVLNWVKVYEQWALHGVLVLIVGLYGFVHGVLPLLSWKGRRLLLGRWRRLTHWEFWPRTVMYVPVLGYIFVWLMWRYGGVRSATVANPAFDGAGGLIGESKICILRHLEASGAPVARFEVLEASLSEDEKCARVQAFLGGEPSEQLRCVLKPEQGCRGFGVCIVDSMEKARKWFADEEGAAIMQIYVPGVEYGVFYIREPEASKGRIFSLTEKCYTCVIGDGRSDLETLILADERTVCMAPFFLKQYEAQLDRVLAEGERFWVAPIGTHARGAVFLDGKDLLTPELEAAFDAFCQRVEGFYFGRFDVKAPSKEALARGEGFQILELNGMTSEATHIYQPGYSLLNGWRTLLTQWRLVYRIGQQNRRRGHRPPSRWSIIKLLIES